MTTEVHRTACIVDGDNVTRGGQLRVPEVAFVMDYLAHLTERWPVTVALQKRLAIDYMTAYAALGWGVKFASMEPDAADKLLLEVAEDYVAHHVTDLIVVSGDHTFAALASRARLHVLAYRKCLSRELELAATDVTYIDDLIPTAA